jgi:hypothetical protein
MSQRLTTEQFIQMANAIHNNRYDYSLVNYINARIKIKIICSIHGIFEQTPDNHLHHGCCTCAHEFVTNIRKINHNKRPNSITNDIFISKAKKLHNNFYSYEKIKCFNMKQKVEIICPKHGSFMQSPDDHLHNRGCPICKKSKGEILIVQYLKEHNIKFVSQHQFKECIGKKKPLPFDFYLPDYNTCIEFDGRQHFEPVDFSSGTIPYSEVLKNFECIKNSDSIKTNYCNTNNIKLLRISYTKLKNINYILSKLL